MSQFEKCKVVMLPTNEKAKIGSFALYHNLYKNREWFLDIVHRIEMQEYLKIWTRNGLLSEGNDAKVKAKYQHIYILSDDEIKEGDWFIREDKLYNEFKTSLTSKVTIFIRLYPNLDLSEQWREVYISDCKKVIATTNTSLKLTKHIPWIKELESRYDVEKGYPKEIELPQPSKSFIEAYVKAYNEGNPITEVMVEYEEDYYTDPKYSYLEQDNPSTKIQKLKIAKDNTITIRKIKDSYSRAEVTELLKKYEKDTLYYGRDGYYNSIDIAKEWIEENL